MTLNQNAQSQENQGTVSEGADGTYDELWLLTLAMGLRSAHNETRWSRTVQVAVKSDQGRGNEHAVERLVWGLCVGYRAPPDGTELVMAAEPTYGECHIMDMYLESLTEKNKAEREPRVATLLGVTVQGLRAAIEKRKANGRAGFGL